MRKTRRRETRILGIPENQRQRPYGLGIDVAAEFHAICLLVPSGDELIRYEWECDNTPRALLAAKRKLNSILPPSLLSDGLTYTLESTATYHYPLMRAWGGSPCVVNPALAASFKARKTDRIDAYKLSLHHLQGLWPPSFIPDASTEVLRALVRTRRRALGAQTRFYNSITTRLVQWNCGDSQRTARNKLIRAIVEDLSVGRYAAKDPAFADHRHVPPRIWQLLERMYRVVDAGRDLQVWIEDQIKEACTGELYNRLLSLPGIGPVTAACWLAEVEPCNRFPSVGHCVAFCGLDPTPQISGGKHVGSKLRGGNSHIRPALIQAGQVLLNGKSRLAAKLLAAGRPRKLAVCIAARKLCELMYLCSLRGVTYDEEKVRPAPNAADAPAATI